VVSPDVSSDTRPDPFKTGLCEATNTHLNHNEFTEGSDHEYQNVFEYRTVCQK